LSIQSHASPIDRRGLSGAVYTPGKVIVKFRDGVTDASRVAALSSATPASRTNRPTYANFDVVQIDAAADAEAAASALRQDPNVEYAQPAYRIRPQLVPNDRYYSRQWNLPLVNLERAWDIQPAAASAIVVAVLDTGVAYTDATVSFRASGFTDADGNTFSPLGDLTLRFVAATELGGSSRFVSPYDFIWNDTTPVDLDGHGTHVSGTIGQLTNNGGSGSGDTANGGGTAGVAFNAKLMPVKVLDSPWDDIFGCPNYGTDETVARGIRYAAENGAHIINMSLGRTGPPSPVVEDAIRFAVSRGVFVAIAAGNDFEDGNAPEVLAEIAGRVNGAVSVAAVDRNRRHAYYSSTGAWNELAAPGGSFRESGAEGGILQQTLDLDLVETYLDPSRYAAPRFDALAYYYMTGTSQATPHVSGAAAMLMQQGIKNPAAIEAALKQFAVDLGDAGRDDTFGFGLIDVRAGLRGLGLAR
jgi:serine protease